jgi:uncharacterized C2H2 Zn-finger protein
MDANSTLQEDLELFRRLMRVMNVLQHRGTIDQRFSPSPSISRQPAFNSDLQRRRPDVDFQDDAMKDGDESTDDDDDDDDGDDDDDDDDEEDEDDDDNDSEEEEEEEDDDDDDDDDEEEEEDDEEDEDDDGSESDELSDYYEEPQVPGGPTNILFPKDPTYVLSDQQPPTSLTAPASDPAKNGARAVEQDAGDDVDLCCWEHGCNGRKFTTRSNLKRHRREKSRARLECRCPRCDAIFSRTTARNTHLARGSCNRIRRYSNGRIRTNLRIKDG